MSRLFSIVVDAIDHVAQARWWAGALATSVTDERDDEAWLPLPSGLELLFVPVPEPKTTKNRIHLDLATYSADNYVETIDRLVGLGAEPVDIGQPDDVDWMVLSDPEGNELCVLTPR